jgi:two-component system phosphate regulon response regulator OmpR
MPEEAHILVVDDDVRLRGLLSRYLADQGFRVTTACSGPDARDKLRFLAPDLLVLDVMMPGETGLQLVESLRRDEDHSELPVLLLTARFAPEDRIAGNSRPAPMITWASRSSPRSWCCASARCCAAPPPPPPRGCRRGASRWAIWNSTAPAPSCAGSPTAPRSA